MVKILGKLLLVFFFVPYLTFLFLFWVLDIPIVIIADIAGLFNSKLSDEERIKRRKERHNAFWYMIPGSLIAYFKMLFAID